MRFISKQAWWPVAAVLGALASFPASGAGPTVAPGTLSGRIVDPAGRGVAGARIWTEDRAAKARGQGFAVEARTDAEGRFLLGPMPAVHLYRWDLMAEAAGFARLTIAGRSFSIYPGQDHDLGAIQVDPGRVFTGRVVDADGTPRAGVTG